MEPGTKEKKGKKKKVDLRAGTHFPRCSMFRYCIQAFTWIGTLIFQVSRSSLGLGIVFLVQTKKSLNTIYFSLEGVIIRYVRLESPIKFPLPYEKKGFNIWVGEC